jgi:hypothetical protein
VISAELERCLFYSTIGKQWKTMASERKQQANRNNAMRNTGPRTERGKLRANLNALRHGLATKQAALPEIERMAKAICGRGASRLQYEEALNVAESQFVLLAGC